MTIAGSKIKKSMVGKYNNLFIYVLTLKIGS